MRCIHLHDPNIHPLRFHPLQHQILINPRNRIILRRSHIRNRHSPPRIPHRGRLKRTQRTPYEVLHRLSNLRLITITQEQLHRINGECRSVVCILDELRPEGCHAYFGDDIPDGAAGLLDVGAEVEEVDYPAGEVVGCAGGEVKVLDGIGADGAAVGVHEHEDALALFHKGGDEAADDGDIVGVGCWWGAGVGAAGEVGAVHGEAEGLEGCNEGGVVGWSVPCSVDEDDGRFGDGSGGGHGFFGFFACVGGGEVSGKYWMVVA